MTQQGLLALVLVVKTHHRASGFFANNYFLINFLWNAVSPRAESGLCGQKLAMSEFSFLATPEKGNVDAILLRPKKAIALLVLAHGAGADLHHRHMTALAEAFYEKNIATLRFNFPYMQQGKPRTDTPAICIETFTNAIGTARQKIKGVPLFIGGHSFGGRMSSHYIAETRDKRVTGLIFCSFPLHNPKKPETKRAEHLYDLETPMLFLSGTRDPMGDPSLIKPTIKKIMHARLHRLDTADHSYKILKRTRKSKEDVYAEAARVAASWITELNEHNRGKQYAYPR